MKISFDSLQFNINVDESMLSKGLHPLVLLHGFTGSANDWNFIFKKLPENYYPVAIDLIGHGESSSPIELDYYSPLAITKQLNHIFSELEFNKIILCGYSMGGRAALNFATQFPQNISGLILESATKGLLSTREKLDRLKNDFALAEKIKTDGIKNFIDYWMNLPLFNSLKKLPSDKYNTIIASKLKNSVVGLSNSLMGFSTGNMHINLTSLSDRNIHVLLITGGLDVKFTEINNTLKDEIQSSIHKIIPNAGHNTHFEKEEDYISIVNNFLINLF